MSKQYENPQATEDSRPSGGEAGAPVHPIRANGKFWGKFMLMKVPGEVPKETLDKYLEPWMCKWVEPVSGRSPWLSRVPATKTNHICDFIESPRP